MDKLTDSEFKAAGKLNLYYKDKTLCPSTVKDCVGVIIEKGEKIPEIFVKGLILNNPEMVENLLKDSVPQLTKEQQKKYGIDIVEEEKKKKAKEPKTDKEVIEKQFPKWNMENLNEKLGYYIKTYKKEGNSRFKDWTEKEFGADLIDKRKSSDNIIVKILKLQDEGKL